MKSAFNRSRADSEGRRGILGCSTATTSRVAGGTTTLAGRFIALLPPQSRDGIDALVFALSGAPALIPRPSAASIREGMLALI